MSDNVDEMVNNWIIQKFIENEYNVNVHGPVATLKVVEADANWDCACYSSWTRDDWIHVESIIESEKGRFTFKSGTYWDLPEFIESMAGDLEESDCRIEQYRRESGNE